MYCSRSDGLGLVLSTTTLLPAVNSCFVTRTHFCLLLKVSRLTLLVYVCACVCVYVCVRVCVRSWYRTQTHITRTYTHHTHTHTHTHTHHIYPCGRTKCFCANDDFPLAGIPTKIISSCVSDASGLSPVCMCVWQIHTSHKHIHTHTHSIKIYIHKRVRTCVWN